MHASWIYAQQRVHVWRIHAEYHWPWLYDTMADGLKEKSEEPKWLRVLRSAGLGAWLYSGVTMTKASAALIFADSSSSASGARPLAYAKWGLIRGVSSGPTTCTACSRTARACCTQSATRWPTQAGRGGPSVLVEPWNTRMFRPGPFVCIAEVLPDARMHTRGGRRTSASSARRPSGAGAAKPVRVTAAAPARITSKPATTTARIVVRARSHHLSLPPIERPAGCRRGRNYQPGWHAAASGDIAEPMAMSHPSPDPRASGSVR